VFLPQWIFYHQLHTHSYKFLAGQVAQFGKQGMLDAMQMIHQHEAIAAYELAERKLCKGMGQGISYTMSSFSLHSYCMWNSSAGFLHIDY
jgi:hypothetical protein